MKKTLLIDLNNIIYRAYFGLSQPLKTPDGQLINAVYGTFNIIYSAIVKFKPDRIIACLDSKNSIRKEEFQEYKNNRSSMPDDLRNQIKLIHQLLEALNIESIMSDGYEADDVINSLVHELKNDNTLYILTGDKDIMQLVSPNCFIYDSMKDIVYDRDKVIGKFGINPEQIVDYLSIVGDSSDNIPGIKGLGEKGTVKLLNEFQTLENIYQNIDQIKGGTKDKLIKGKDSAFLSQKLATLRLCPVILTQEKWSLDKEKINQKLSEWNMKTAITKINTLVI